MGQRNCHPEPGDLIEIDRSFHQHWALFLGDGYVINLTPVGRKLAQTLGVHNVPEFIRKVKKQPLKEVVGNNKWCINNKSDQDCTPLPVEEIIRHAEGLIDMEMTYHGYGSNCERFVKSLRYGDQPSDFLSGEMRMPGMAHGMSNAKRGDLIEIKQPIHHHWALYVGDGYVVHVTAVAGTETTLTGKAKMKKELLTNVVGNDEWHVNNKYDWCSIPLTELEIIWRAERWIDKEVPYDMFGSNCERFVKRLRYGDQTRNFVCGKMHIPAMTHGRHNPSPGDLIEIKQPIHHHWALYVGDGYVVHVTAVDENALPLSADAERTLTRKVKVKKELLTNVVGNDDWRIYNKYDWYCTPLPVEEIVRRAERCIDKEVPKTLFSNNSEKFVEKLRYGSWRKDFVLGERHIPELAHAMCYPDPGDLIEIKQPIHHHWALYVGKGYVVHVTAVDENAPPLPALTDRITTRKVKKELLMSVVGNDDWAVNNKYDWYRTPLPVEEIIRRAEGDIDKEVPYDVFGGKSGRFVKSLRYGDQWRDFVRGKMHIPEMAQDTSNPDPGDLIEIKWGLYQHWALYVGDGYVVHVTAVGTETMLNGMVKVKKELLTKVAENDEWRVNNKYDWYRTPLPVEEIVRRAEDEIDKEVPYLCFRNESEHFVVKLRYGDQPSDFLSVEMHIPELAQDRSDPDPGDLIEIKRRGYEQWALCVGDGYVIHVTAVGTETTLLRKAKMKKELLRNVVGNDDWRVNNKYDWYRTPLPVEEIIWRAEHWIDKEVPYDVFGRKCERFVKRLRYGGQWRDFVRGEMHTPELTHSMSNTKRGDLIEIKRPIHHHWALYVGKGYVVHVTAVAGTEATLTRKLKVKKELLMKVAENDDWAVNNKYDWYCTPLPVEEIVRRAEGDIDKEVPNLWFRDESEHFVEKLRYGDQRSDFLSGEMHILELADGMRYPNPGDLIEFKRLGYEHWAVYVGEGHVIHVTGLGAGSPSFSVSSVTLLTRMAMVKKELLTSVAGNDDWAVNNKYDWFRTPFPVEEIIRRAERWIGKVVPYRVLIRNCEHFVTEIRYGQAFCEQTRKALSAGDVVSRAAAGLGLVSVLFVPALTPAVAFIGVGLLTRIGVNHNANIYVNAYAKFRGAKRDILEQTCC